MADGESLRQILEQATPGPWMWGNPWGHKEWADHVNAYGLQRRPGHSEDKLACFYTADRVVLESGRYDYDYDCLEIREADARLAALAPELASLVLDMGEELRAWKMSSGDFRQVVSTEALLARLDQLGKEPGDE